MDESARRILKKLRCFHAFFMWRRIVSYSLVHRGEGHVEAKADSTILAFLINRSAPVTHAGTIGQ